jgi:hypothetical protein
MKKLLLIACLVAVFSTPARADDGTMWPDNRPPETVNPPLVVVIVTTILSVVP